MNDVRLRQHHAVVATLGRRGTDALLVCVSSSPEAELLVRVAQRMAGQLRIPWIAAHAETPASLRLSDSAHQRVNDTLLLAETLGGEAMRLQGANAADATLRYAHERRVRKIVVGKPTHSGRRELLWPSFVQELIRGSGGIDVHIISGASTDDVTPGEVPSATKAGWVSFVTAFLTVAACTGFSALVFRSSHVPEVAMVYVLGVVLVSTRLGYGASLFTAMLSVLALDYYFVPPYLSFAISDIDNVVTLAVLLVVAVVISTLTKRIRDQSATASRRERRTARLYAMSRDLANTPTLGALLGTAVRHLAEAFDAHVIILLPNASGSLEVAVDGVDTFLPGAVERELAENVWQNERSAGLGTDTSSSARGLYVLLRGSRGKVGVLGIQPAEEGRFLQPEQHQLLDAFAAQVGSALERGQLAETAQAAQVEIETERLRSSLLSSVSHDLRTPLGVITGATSTLLQGESFIDAAARRDLLETAHEEAERLDRLVRNLLDMTRLSSGRLYPKKEWHPLDEIIGVALNRLEDRLRERDVSVHLPVDLPPIPIDAVLVEQVLINLLENALKYTPSGSPIEISARARPNAVEVEVADRGPGVPPGERNRVFEKFFRLRPNGPEGGAGLGLAICRGVVEAHGGRIWVENRPEGGASFHFTVPIDGVPPVMAAETWPRAS
ncbi:MAG TPA: ATP-binding protein [Polyangiaceae bacterium]